VIRLVLDSHDNYGRPME